MRDCKDLDAIRKLDVDDVVRKPTYEDAADVLVLDTNER